MTATSCVFIEDTTSKLCTQPVVPSQVRSGDPRQQATALKQEQDLRELLPWRRRCALLLHSTSKLCKRTVVPTEFRLGSPKQPATTFQREAAPCTLRAQHPNYVGTGLCLHSFNRKAPSKQPATAQVDTVAAMPCIFIEKPTSQLCTQPGVPTELRPGDPRQQATALKREQELARIVAAAAALCTFAEHSTSKLGRLTEVPAGFRLGSPKRPATTFQRNAAPCTFIRIPTSKLRRHRPVPT